MLNLHILHGTYGPQIPYGCTYIRLLRPLTHPSILPDDPASWAGADSYGAALLGHWADQRARATNRDWNSLYQGMPFDAEGALLTAEDVRAATDGSIK